MSKKGPRLRLDRTRARARQACGAFTLIELICSIGILAILGSMILPTAHTTVAYGRNAKCLANLRQIGAAATLCAQDNDNTYPYIEANTKDPVYSPDKNAKGLLETLAPYGVTVATLKCPEDIAGPNCFSTHGSSYQWLNYADGEKMFHVKLVTPEGEIEAPPSSIRLAVDWMNVHFPTKSSGEEMTPGRRNAVYADGHATVSGG